MLLNQSFSLDYVAIRKALIREIQAATNLDSDHIITEEPETQNSPRPTLPYISMKITSPAIKQGDDDKRNIPTVAPAPPGPSNTWNSGGQRKMIVSFNAYGRSHEEAYNYMTLWQSALDLETTQGDLRNNGIAVWLMESVADVSQLLNTGYEGRAHLDVTFGIASNISQTLGEMDSVEVKGTIATDSGTVDTDDTVDFGG
jgi:hypothetical protein